MAAGSVMERWRAMIIAQLPGVAGLSVLAGLAAACSTMSGLDDFRLAQGSALGGAGGAGGAGEGGGGGAGAGPASGCGDGVIAAPETCDDGNAAAGDGCSDACAKDMGSGLSGAQAACLDDGRCAYVPSPGAGPGTDLTDFIGELAAGDWRVCVGDGDNLDAGTLEMASLTVFAW